MENVRAEEEIMVPGIRLLIAEEILHDTVKDIHKNIKGMFALHQQFYFFTLNILKGLTKTEEQSMIRIFSTHPNRKELLEKLSLSGITRLDIVLNPGIVTVQYPQYNSRWEYRGTDVYNTVIIENPPENPTGILRIEKRGCSESELFCVRKKNSWAMRKWSEVLLYPDDGLFDRKIDVLLHVFGVPKDSFDYAVSSFSQ